MDRSSRIRLDDDYPICVAHLVSIERADARADHVVLRREVRTVL